MNRFFQQAIRRRVPQVLGLYLAAFWGVLEFTGWAITRFALDFPLDAVVLSAGLLAVPLVCWIAWRFGAPAALPPLEAPARSVAVLPFATPGGGPDAEVLGFGLADQIVADLSRVADLHVVARTSSFAFSGEAGDVRAIGRKLGARAVLEGTIQRSGDRLRVTTQLIDAGDGYHLWSERYDRTIDDVFQIQDEISANVARVLEAVLREHERRNMEKVYTRNVDAYELYLRGRRFFLQSRRRSLEFAREMFQRAIALDGDFALAFAGIADTAAVLATLYPAASAELDRALEASRRALALDPELAEAHSAHGAVLFARGEMTAAEAAFQRAVALDPRLFEARYFHARACFQQGRFGEAARLFEEASAIREDYNAAFFAAQSLEAAGEHDRARAAYTEALRVAERHMEFNPDDPRAANIRAVALCRVGRVEDGLAWADRALTLDPEDDGVRYNAACLFALAGRVDRALACLEEALARGFGNRKWLANDPDLDNLRNDPRFAAIMARVESPTEKV